MSSNQLHEPHAGLLDAEGAQAGGEQGQGAGVALHGVDEPLDGLALAVVQPAGGRAGADAAHGLIWRLIWCLIWYPAWCLAQRLLDQRDGVLGGQAVQLAAVVGVLERVRQRLAAGEQQPGGADGQEPRGQGEDLRQAVGALVHQQVGGVRVQGARQQTLQVVQHDDGGLLAQGALDGQAGLVRTRKGGDAVARLQLAAEGVEHGVGGAVGLDGDEGGLLALAGADAPARQLAGERGLALAALAADQGPGLGVQQAFQRQQLAGAADEAGGGRVGQPAEADLEVFVDGLDGARSRDLGEQPWVVLLLVEHGHEPVLQAQRAGAEDLAAGVVLVQGLLAREHGITDAHARRERAVERLHEAPGGLHQHRVGHGDDAGDAGMEQLGGDGFGGVLGQRGLAGLEEDQRDAVVLEQRAEVVGVDGAVAAALQLAGVRRLLEAQPAQALLPVVDAVTVEVDDVVGPALPAGLVQGLAQGRQGRRAQDVQRHQAAQVLDRVHQRQGRDAVVDAAAGVVLRARADQQNADRWVEQRVS
jgi:hypothetical protein